MYTNISNIEFIDMTDKDKFISLMKYHWKDVSQYIELVCDKRTKFSIHITNANKMKFIFYVFILTNLTCSIFKFHISEPTCLNMEW